MVFLAMLSKHNLEPSV